MSGRVGSLIGVLIVLDAAAAPAQSYATDRGVWQAGGVVRFSHQHGSGGLASITTLAVDPEIAYFVAPGLAVGAATPLLYSWLSGGHAVSYGAGPTATYYFGSGIRTLYPYVGASVALLRNRLYASGNAVTTDNQWSWEARAGAVRLVARNAGITGEVYYRHLHETSTTTGTRRLALDEYGLRFGLGLFLY